MVGEAKSVPIRHKLPVSAGPVLEHLYEGLERCRFQSSCMQSLLKDMLEIPSLRNLASEDYLPTRLFLEVLEDLVKQGWRVGCHNGELIALPPDATNGDGADRSEVKQRIRASLVEARNEQLREEAARRFILDLERPRWHRGSQVSVLDLFASPQELAADLKRRANSPEGIREGLLRDAVQPYLQRATEDRDEFTNIKLIDVWRYCRYTWSLPLNSQPGRKMFYLVRDRARKFHPVIGIGALGSSVVQITDRDKAIGWTVKSLRGDPDPGTRVIALEAELRRAIDEILWQDLLSEEERENPTPDVLSRLIDISKAGPAVNRSAREAGTTTLEADARSHVYRRKRATEIYRLLRAEQAFRLSTDVADNAAERMEWLQSSAEGRRALGVALRSVKKRHVGSSMMDITTCGALPPYSEVLGGKLVSLLMCSPQVIADYRSRYEAAPSEIASRMRGKELVRPAELVLLGTTSLYHVGSSQYNRLSAPTANGTLRFLKVGKTAGFGTLHLSRRTYQTLQELLRRHPELEPESSAFAAGVNFKLRSVESGLSYIGLENLQRHDSPRLVYIVPLATNWQEYLTGLDSKPKSLFSDVQEPEVETSQLIDFWVKRWFVPRALRPRTLQALQGQTEDLRVSMFLDGGTPLLRGKGFMLHNSLMSGDLGAEGEGMAAQATISWRVLAQLKENRTSFAELLSDAELEALHVQTKLDEGLAEIVLSGRRVYLAGNPGDGKTHMIRKLLPQLEDAGVYVSLDASAVEEDILLAGLKDAIVNQRASLVAINEGPLRRILPGLPEDERRQLRAQLDKPYLYGEEDTRKYEAVVVNLGHRQALSPEILDGALDLVLNRVDYSDAPEVVRNNRSALGRQRVRERLLLLLGLVARGGAHVTMHELLGFLAHAITAGESDYARASAIAPYYQLLFDDGSPLLLHLRGLDPAHISYPLIDMWLWEGSGAGHIEWMETPQETPPGRQSDPQEGLEAFHALKRRYFLEAKDGHALLNMLPEDRRTFYDLLSNSRTARDTAKTRVLEALAYFFGDRDQIAYRGGIRVWTSLRYEAVAPPSAYVSSQVVPDEMIDIYVPLLRDQVASLLEYEPTHARMVVRSGHANRAPVGLTLDLDLWLALMKLKRGMPQRNHDPVIGRKLHLFMSRLAAEHQKTQSGYVQLQARDVDTGETYQVRASLEKGTYQW